MTQTRREMLWFALAAASGLGGALGWQFYRRPVLDAQRLDGLWSAEFASPDGGRLRLSDFRGRPLVVNFWATWCPPCVAEMPLLDAFFRQNKSKGWQVIGLAIDQPEHVQAFLRSNPVTYPVGLAEAAGSDWLRQLGNDAGSLPFTLVLQPDGSVLAVKLGKLSEQEIENWLKISF